MCVCVSLFLHVLVQTNAIYFDVKTAKTILKVTFKVSRLFFPPHRVLCTIFKPAFQENKYVDNCRKMYFSKLVPCNVM